MEKYVVFNPTNSVISFQLKPSYSDDELAGISKHKVRRLVRGNAIPIAVKPHTSVDLVALSNMSVDVIRNNSELHTLVRQGVLQVMETTIVQEIPDEVEAPKDVLLDEEVFKEEAKEEIKEEVKLPDPPPEVKPEIPLVPPVPKMPSIPKQEPKKGAKKKD